MTATVVVGVLFFSLVAYGAYLSLKSIRNNTCPGCSGSCSVEQRSNCQDRINR